MDETRMKQMEQVERVTRRLLDVYNLTQDVNIYEIRSQIESDNLKGWLDAWHHAVQDSFIQLLRAILSFNDEEE